MTGVVRRYDTAKGYGFIVPDDGGHDVFVHQNALLMDEPRYLNEGEHVVFDLAPAIAGRRHRSAANVRLLHAICLLA